MLEHGLDFLQTEGLLRLGGDGYRPAVCCLWKPGYLQWLITVQLIDVGGIEEWALAF